MRRKYFCGLYFWNPGYFKKFSYPSTIHLYRCILSGYSKMAHPLISPEHAPFPWWAASWQIDWSWWSSPMATKIIGLNRLELPVVRCCLCPSYTKQHRIAENSGYTRHIANVGRRCKQDPDRTRLPLGHLLCYKRSAYRTLVKKIWDIFWHLVPHLCIQWNKSSKLLNYVNI